MFFWRKDPISVGMDISSSCLRVAILRYAKGAWQKVLLKEYSLPLDTDAVKQLDKLAKEGVLVSAVDSRKVLVRPLEIPLKKTKDLEEALDFQVEPHLPFSLEESIVDYQILNTTSSTTKICFFAVKKEHLTDHLNQLQNLPDVVTATPACLSAFAKGLFGAPSSQLVLYVGKNSSILVAIEEGKLLSTTALSQGYAHLKESSFKMGLLKMVKALEPSFQNDPPSSILLVSEHKDLSTTIEKSIEKAVIIPTFSPFNTTQQDLHTFALAIGAALHPHIDKEVNFRKKEFKYFSLLKKLKMPLTVSFSLVALLASSLFCLGRVHLKNQENLLTQQGLTFLATQNRRANKKNFYKTLFAYEKENLKKPSTSFPLFPKTPQVSSLLDWLSEQARPFPTIELISMQYHLVEFPSLTNTNKHYRPEVEIYFTTKNPLDARAFHDQLAQQKDFLNTNEGIKWIAERNNYRAIFYLKDKTHYVGP